MVCFVWITVSGYGSQQESITAKRPYDGNLLYFFRVIKSVVVDSIYKCNDFCLFIYICIHFFFFFLKYVKKYIHIYIKKKNVWKYITKKAKTYPNVSVLFCYISDFSRMVARTPPMKLIRQLNVVFTTFDLLTEDYEVYKVR